MDQAAGVSINELLTRMEELQATVAEQQVDLTRLKAAASTPVVVGPPAVAVEPRVGRRHLLRKAMAATAVATVLAIAADPREASANFRGTLQGGGASTPNYGLVAALGAGTDPALTLP